MLFVLTFHLLFIVFIATIINLQHIAPSGNFWVIWKYSFHFLVRFTALVWYFFLLINCLNMSCYLFTFQAQFTLVFLFHHVIMYFFLKYVGTLYFSLNLRILWSAPSHLILFILNFYPGQCTSILNITIILCVLQYI